MINGQCQRNGKKMIQPRWEQTFSMVIVNDATDDDDDDDDDKNEIHDYKVDVFSLRLKWLIWWGWSIIFFVLFYLVNTQMSFLKKF